MAPHPIRTGTSSADPLALDGYRIGSDAIGDAVLRAMAGLASELAAVPASPSVVGADALVAGLFRFEAAHRRLAGWVGEVATAFRRADAGAPPPVPGIDDGPTRGLAGVLRATARLVGDHHPADVAGLLAALAAGSVPAGPDEVRAVAALLSPADLAALVRADPQAVGSLDGWPVASRVAANRLLIERDLASATGRRRAALAALLRADPGTGRPRQILLYDGAGDGRVAEVFGDLERARDVVLFVPGMANDLDHFDHRVAERARRLYDEGLAADADRPLAVVAWLGYDSPDDLPSGEVLSPRQAAEGADRLGRTLAGLALGPQQRVSLVAHSYGTVLVGEALRDGARAENVLLMGSPGLGVGRAQDLHRGSDTDFFTMEAPGDLVTTTHAYGPDPNRPGSGFTRLETRGQGHSSYLADGSLSLLNAVAVIRDDDAGLHERGGSAADAVEAPIRAAHGPQRWLDERIDAWQRRHPSVLDAQVDLDQIVLDVAADAVLPGGPGEAALDLITGWGRALGG